MALPFSMPPPTIPIVDADGKITPPWFLFLSTIIQALGGPVIQPGIPSMDSRLNGMPILLSDEDYEVPMIIPGLNGVQGISGSQGIIGPVGEDGLTIEGPPGIQGIAGAIGLQGIPGMDGTDGDDASNVILTSPHWPGLIFTATGINVSLTSGMPADVASLTLPTGKYILFASANVSGGSVSTGLFAVGINDVSATFPAEQYYTLWQGSIGAGSQIGFPAPTQPVEVNGSDIYYCVVQANFVGTCSATGYISAIKID